MRRIVSVWLKNFPIDRLKWQTQRSAHSKPAFCQDDLSSAENRAFALVAKDTNGMRIVALNDEARRRGVHDGMRLQDARALLPSLQTDMAEPEADVRALRKLANWCQRYTPVASLDGANGLWLDMTGATHLHGGEDRLLADLGRRLSAIGFENNPGLAETPGAAWAVARFANMQDRQIVPTGCLLHALHPLPLEALRLDEKTVHLLRRFGLKTIGALYALPRASLKRRFASKDIHEAVLHRLDQAFGRVREPINPLESAPLYVERLSFPEPILVTESFHLGIHQLLQQLAQRMERDGKGVMHLTFSAYHADGGFSRISIATARPSRDPQHLAHIFRDRIEAINPGFGVDVLTLSADAVEPLDAGQMMLSGRSRTGLDQNGLDQLVDRLSNRLGARHVQRIVLRESHMPECAEKRIAAQRLTLSGSSSADCKPPRPKRLLAKPEPVQVMAEVPEGPPVRFTWRRVTHTIVRAEGPERIAPEWWHAPQERKGIQYRTRDYYRVEDEQGRRFWLFREGLYRDADKDDLPTWHMHGLFA